MSWWQVCKDLLLSYFRSQVLRGHDEVKSCLRNDLSPPWISHPNYLSFEARKKLIRRQICPHVQDLCADDVEPTCRPTMTLRRTSTQQGELPEAPKTSARGLRKRLRERATRVAASRSPLSLSLIIVILSRFSLFFHCWVQATVPLRSDCLYSRFSLAR